jgi:hypothetical protein
MDPRLEVEVMNPSDKLAHEDRLLVVSEAFKEATDHQLGIMDAMLGQAFSHGAARGRLIEAGINNENARQRRIELQKDLDERFPA